MAFEDRRPLLNVSGVLDADISALDTTITSTAFTNLPTYFTSQIYLPLVLTDSAGNAEVVYATAHASGSKALTVTRNREGTTSRKFSAGDRVRCTPTPLDTGKVFGHIGQISPTQQTLPNTAAGIVVQLAVADQADLGGGMTVSNYGLVVPAGQGGMYRCTARGYLSAGTNTTNAQFAVRKNDVATNLLDARINKRTADAYDDPIEFQRLIRLAENDRVNLWGRTLNGYAGSSYGADGYLGSFLELEKVA